MRGDAYGKGDPASTYHPGGRCLPGNMTPSGTPGSNSILPPGGRPHNFQRTNSNESGKGSFSSDKELHYPCNGNAGGDGGGGQRD